MAARVKANFIEPMLLLRTDRLPEGEEWAYEIKWHGYRAIAFKSGGQVHLRSRNDNDFNEKYPAIVEGLTPLPADTVIDGEVVAFDKWCARANVKVHRRPLRYAHFRIAGLHIRT